MRRGVKEAQELLKIREILQTFSTEQEQLVDALKFIKSLSKASRLIRLGIIDDTGLVVV